MNYIAQLTAAIDKLSRDDTLNPSHVSLYIALFYQWNINRFKNPISVCRTDTMLVSKIGSKSTYHKCIHDLHSKKFLTYEPSHNPLRGSLINMTIFKTSTRTTTEQPVDKLQTSTEQALVPSINSNKLNKQLNSKNIDREKSSTAELFPSPEKEKKSSIFLKPTLEQLQEYFTSEKSTNQEAQKFYLHYESNGWMVGKTKMKNWKAAAKNWITRSSNFSKPNPLSTHQNKNYSEPL